MQRTILAALLLLSACAQPQAVPLRTIGEIEFAPPSIAGDWWGTLQVGERKLRLIVHFTDFDRDGVYEGTLDSIDQGSRGLPLSNVEVTAEKIVDQALIFPTLSFDLREVGGKFVGRLEDETWVGLWSQGSQIPLVLERGSPEPD